MSQPLFNKESEPNNNNMVIQWHIQDQGDYIGKVACKSSLLKMISY